MEKLTVFYLEGCPYCRNARKAFAELAAETPEYGETDVEWIEESRHPDIVKGRQYYYVPTIYAGETKLYEDHPGEPYAECKANVKAALDAVHQSRN